MFINEISQCCKELLLVEGGEEGTKYYICAKCRKPSDPLPKEIKKILLQ